MTFHIEMFSTNMTLTTLSIWIFTWKIHLGQYSVKCVDNISRRNENNGKPTKKHLIFFIPVWRFQYFRHLLQNPNLKLMSSFPNNHYRAYTFLVSWALKKIYIYDLISFHIVTCFDLLKFPFLSDDIFISIYIYFKNIYLYTFWGKL